MKKLLVSLLICALAVFACCACFESENTVPDGGGSLSGSETDNKGNDDGKDEDKQQITNRLSGFSDGYEAVASYSFGSSGIDYFVTFGGDYLTVIQRYGQENETAFYYEKGEENEVDVVSLTKDNTIKKAKENISWADDAPKSMWGEHIYVNGLSGFDFPSDKTEFKIADDDLAKVLPLNGQLCPTVKSMRLTPDSARFFVEDGKIKYESFYGGDGSIKLAATFGVKSANVKCEVRSATAESNKLKARLDALKNNNYTAEFYLTAKNDTQKVKAATLQVNDDKIYVDYLGENAAKYGYNKTADGYNMVVKKNFGDGDKYYLSGETENGFATLLPSFAFAAEAFDCDDGKYTPNRAVTASSVADTFTFVDWNAVVFGNFFRMELTDDDISVISESASNGTVYTLVFKNVGATVLAEDVSVFETMPTWDSEMSDGIIAMFGNADAVPFCDATIGDDWFFDVDTDYLEATKYFDEVPATAAQKQQEVEKYAAKLAALGYVKLTADELADLEKRSALSYKEDDRAYWWHTFGEDGDAYVYWIDDTHTIEIGVDSMFEALIITVCDVTATYQNWMAVDASAASAFKSSVGCFLPYLDTGYDWYLDYDEDGAWFDFVCEDIPDGELAAKGDAFIALLEEKGYVRLTAAQVEADGVDIYADSAEEAIVYRINDDYVVEVCPGTSYYTGLYISVTLCTSSATA